MHDAAWPSFTAAVAAFAAGDLGRAAEAARRASAADPASLLAAEAAAYLERLATGGGEGVYAGGEAFGAFIRGGGNLPLYAAVSAALANAYTPYRALALLDVGVGDGMALLPALTPGVARVDLVEPSAPMLGRATAALAERGVPFRAFPMGVLQFAERARARWELAQATFSLQSLTPEDRRAALAWLRAHADRLLVAEFDAPALAAGLDPARVAHIAARYELGLAEYAGDGALVAQGFLMPVFFGNFDPTAARTNYEQPIAAWEDDLRAAGFARVARRHLFDYWWAPAYLLDAS
ncbi:MAG TPA: class I SAM-dependent methyltransferase [Chloroflexaceae bacterium]|nr:class I SAM-dependent methyltransferase [Chloroflexaceae bacterium]